MQDVVNFSIFIIDEPMNDNAENSVHQEVLSEVEEEQREKLGRRICFWLALVVSIVAAFFISITTLRNLKRFSECVSILKRTNAP